MQLPRYERKGQAKKVKNVQKRKHIRFENQAW